MIVLINLGSSPARVQYKHKGKAYQRVITQNCFTGFRNLTSLTQLDSLASLRTQGILVYDFNTSEFAINARGFTLNESGQNYDLQGNVLEFRFISDIGKFGATITFVASSVSAGLNILNSLVKNGSFPSNSGPSPLPQPPIYGNQTILSLVDLEGEENYYYILFDYTSSNIIGPLDTGVNRNIYDLGSVIPFTEEGYVASFYESNNNDNKIYQTYTSNGDITMTMSADTGNWGDGELDGKLFYLIDYENDVFSLFNATQSGQTSIPDKTITEINNNWNAVTVDGKTCITITDGITQESSIYLHGVSNSGLTTSLLKNYNSGSENITALSYFSGDKVVLLSFSGNTYNRIEVFNTEGTLVEEIVLSGGNYSNYYNAFYGDNKFIFNFIDESDADIPYLLINYDGVTNELLIDSHERGSNFDNFLITSNEFFYPENYATNNAYIAFYSQSGNTGFMTDLSYLDFYVKSPNYSGFNSYTIKGPGGISKGIAFNSTVILDNSICVPITNGEYISAMSISESGVTYTQLEPLTGSPNVWSYSLGLGSAMISWGQDGDYTKANVYALSENGTLRDSLNLNLPGNFDFVLGSARNNMYVGDTVTGWYINQSTSGFSEIGYYHQTYESSECFYSSFTKNGNIVLYNYDTDNFLGLTMSGISQQINVPSIDGHNISVGDNYFIILYSNEGSPNGLFDVYDFGGYRMYREEFPYSNSDVRAVKQRGLAKSSEEGSAWWKMILPDTSINISISGNTISETADDFINWDD